MLETFIGDTVALQVDCGLNIVPYAIKQIRYKKPDGVTGCWTATQCAGDTECLTYTTDANDLDVAGKWSIQSYVAGGGVVLHGKWDYFKVYEPMFETCTTVPPTTLPPTT